MVGAANYELLSAQKENSIVHYIQTTAAHSGFISPLSSMDTWYLQILSWLEYSNPFMPRSG
jgi:hypothetical protein